MSIFEWNLARGITKNASNNNSPLAPNGAYPVADSQAFTSNSRLGFKAKLKDNLQLGAEFEAYTLSDSDNTPPSAGSARRWRTAQVFGAAQPAGMGYNALLPESIAWNKIMPPSVIQLFSAWLNGKGKNHNWKASFGSFWPSFGEGYKNEIKIDHYFFRYPLSSMSLFSHQVGTDREFYNFKMLPREPVRGLEIDGKSGNFDYYFFTGNPDETPRSPNTYYRMSGGRIGYTDKKFKLGVNIAGAELTNPRTSSPALN